MKNPIVALVFLVATVAQAQTSRFLFDANGNLSVQMPDTIASPVITGQPQNQTPASGETATFSVVVADPRSLTYQWRFNGGHIGANAASLLIDSVHSSDQGTYDVVLSNPSGSVTSAPAFLMLDEDSDGMGDSWELTHFANLNQNATRDFDGDRISNLREFLEGTDPTDSESARYRLIVIREGGSVVKAPDQLGYDKGELVTLTVTASPEEIFHAWLGDIVTRDNPLTLVMTNDLTVHARFTPIVFTWTNVSAGQWETATNWSPQLAPGLDDIAIINNPVTVTLNTDVDCSEITLGGAGPTLTGSGTLKVRDNLFWTAGTMSGTGRTIIGSNANLNVLAGVTLNTRTLENEGTIRWSSDGVLGVGGGAVISNRPGALFRVENDTGLLGGLAAGRFDNAGVFRKSTGTGTLTVGLAFNNHGTVEIEAGSLSLLGGGTNSGSFDVLAGTGLTFSGGTFTGSGTSIITGAGRLTFASIASTFAGLVNVGGSNIFSSGAVNLGGNYICTNNALTVSGGTVNLTGSHLCTNTIATISSGTLNFSGTGLVEPATLNLNFGTLDGSATVTIRDAMNWSGGTMSGSGRTIIPPGVTLQLPGSGGVSLNTRTLENAGTVLWTGTGFIGMNFGAVITNRAGALFHVQNSGTLFSGAGANRFDNAGTFRKTTSPGTTTLNNIFNNFGTVDIQTGMLLCNGSLTNNGAINLSAGTSNRLAGGGSSSGPFAAPATALVEWTGGTFTLNTGAQLNGTGLYRINGNSTTVAANEDVTVQNFDLVNSSSTLSGAGVLTIAKAMNWTAGGMDAPGRTIIPAGASLHLGGADSIGLRRTLENNGTVLWTGTGGIILLNGVISNRAGASFEVQSAAPFFFAGGACRIDNAGMFRRTVATGATTIPSGVLFTNSGTVDIRGGIIAANGGYVSSSNAVLHCALGGTTAGTNYGQLQVAGAVMLNGALSVELLPGFTPQVNDAFTVLTAGSRNGAFTDFAYPSNAVTMQLSNTANAVVVHITDVLTAKPQPMLLPPVILGTNFGLTWTAVSNTIYRVEFNPGLTPSNWLVLPGDIVGVSNTASKLDPLTRSNRFYRVRVLP